MLNREDCWRETDMRTALNRKLATFFGLEKQTWHEHLHDEPDGPRRLAVRGVACPSNTIFLRVKLDIGRLHRVALDRATGNELYHAIKPS